MKVCLKLLLLAALLFSASLEPLHAADPDIDPNNLLPVDNQNAVRWGPLLNESLFFLGVEHGYRFIAEPFTRDRMNGKFFADYGASIGNLHGWGDGDPFVINYVGHPMEGAVTGFLFVQNDPRYMRTEFGKNRAYWKSRLRATAFAFISSELFEIGPLSEASLGNTQKYFPQQGLVDHVITPTVGMVWMIGEDWIDRTLIRDIEARTRNPYLKLLARGGLNPARSMANAMRLEVPWTRDTRGGVFTKNAPLLAAGHNEMDEHAPLPASSDLVEQKPLSDLEGGPAPRFNLTSTYSYYQLAIGKSGSLACQGGGANATYNFNRWFGMAADVGGCKMVSPGTNISGDTTLYVAGPRFTFANRTRWTPYFSVMAGGDKIAIETMYPDRKPPNTENVGVAESAVLHSLYTSQDQTNAVALAVGGGVDYEVNRVFALRVVDVSNVHTWAKEVNGRHYPNNLRVSTGITLHFGNW